jgi:hypothetical protein
MSCANRRVFRSLLILSRYLKTSFAMLFETLGVEHVLVAIPEHLVTSFIVRDALMAFGGLSGVREIWSEGA